MSREVQVTNTYAVVEFTDFATAGQVEKVTVQINNGQAGGLKISATQPGERILVNVNDPVNDSFVIQEGDIPTS